MKSVVEWDEDYVLNLPQGEHDWVEFKSSKLLDLTLSGVKENIVLDELSKQVSAFANSGGGSIVYGIQDTPIGTPRTIDSFGGVSLNAKKNGTKEWLEDVIPNSVDFSIQSFNVYVLTPQDATSGIASGKGIFIIDIPSSDIAPHQANDKRYYARIGGKSKPINHRFVIDIMGRAKHPKSRMEVRFLSEKEARNRSYTGKSKPTISARCRNIGSIYANYINGWIYLPKSLFLNYDDPILIEGKEFYSIYFENIHKDKVGEYDRYMPLGENRGTTTKAPLYATRFDPVLPKLSCFVISEELKVSTMEELENFTEEEIHWKVYADNAPVEKDFITVKELLENYKNTES